MRRSVAAAGCALVALFVLADAQHGIVVPTHAQAGSLQTTFQGNQSGGWAGACDDWWASTEFPFNAMRVCRVATYLFRGFNKALSLSSAQGMVNQAFRICWGNFPQAGANCNIPNAWARHRSWASWTAQGAPGPPPQPIVITLQASELVQSDDEMAFILSHEMGHAFDPEQTREEVEQRADSLGIGFMVNAGFDARSAGRSLQMIGRERGQGVAGNLLWTLFNHAAQAATQDAHGTTQERIARMREVFVKGCVALNNRPIGCKEGWK